MLKNYILDERVKNDSEEDLISFINKIFIWEVYPNKASLIQCEIYL